MQTTTKITKRKFENLQACAQPSGVIAALAMDQRASLRKALESVDGGSFSDEQLGEFKRVVTRTLTPHASAILLDPQYGLGASRARAEGSGLLFAYEQSGYDNTKPGRLPDLAPGWSVQRLAEAGATGVKLLVYYNPLKTRVSKGSNTLLSSGSGRSAKRSAYRSFSSPSPTTPTCRTRLNLPPNNPPTCAKPSPSFPKTVTPSMSSRSRCRCRASM